MVAVLAQNIKLSVTIFTATNEKKCAWCLKHSEEGWWNQLRSCNPCTLESCCCWVLVQTAQGKGEECVFSLNVGGRHVCRGFHFHAEIAEHLIDQFLRIWIPDNWTYPYLLLIHNCVQCCTDSLESSDEFLKLQKKISQY